MVSFLATLFIVTFILQPFEWIGSLSGVPLQEILILLILVLAPITNPARFIEFFKLQTTRYFIFFIVIAIFSGIWNGMGMTYSFFEAAPMLVRLFLSYMVLTLALDSLEKIRFAVLAAVISNCIVALFCIRLHDTGVGVGHGIGESAQELNWRGGVQWLGSIAGSNNTALLLVVGFGLALGFNFKTENKMTRYLSVFCMPPIALAIYYTGSRGGLLGLFGVIITYLYFTTNMSIKKSISYIGIFLVVLILFKPESEVRSVADSSSNERVDLLYNGLEMVKAKPLLGVGYGQFSDNNPIHKVAHNIFLQHVAETGVIGVSLFFLMFYAAIRNTIRFFNENTEVSAAYNVTIGIWCGTVGLAICTFFLTAFHFLPYIVLGLLTALSLTQGVNKKITFTDIRLVLAIEVLVILLIYIAINLYMKLFH